MDVRYVDPLRRAWDRARGMLFPFRIETWLVLGFAAFLSEWLSGTAFLGRGGGGARVGPGHLPHPSDLMALLVWTPLVAGILLIVLVVATVLLWLGSRGKFVFLDDVVQRRAAIVEPWNRLSRLGDSLFLWKLVFGLVVGVAVLAVVAASMGSVLLAWLRFRTPFAMAPPIALGIALTALIALLAAFVFLMADSFVVPIMYRNGISATAAWSRFLPLLGAHPGAFVAYAVYVFVLAFAAGVVVIAIGFGTCCVGFLLMLGPYVGQVVLLPLYLTFRALSLEFLAQFGPEWNVLAPAAPAPAPAPAAGA